MDYNIVHNKQDLSNISTLLKRLPQDWHRDKASMAIFRKASKPMLIAGRSMISRSVPNLASSPDVRFMAKPDKTRTIMRVGLINKGKGRLGHLFNFGTAERMNYTSGRKTGKIKARGWWDTAVNMARPLVENEIDKVAPQVISRYARKYKR